MQGLWQILAYWNLQSDDMQQEAIEVGTNAELTAIANVLT